jgi:hypothetical protein
MNHLGIFNAALKLTLIQLRMALIAVEAAIETASQTAEPTPAGEPPPTRPITDTQIDAAANAILAKMIVGRELGFAALLRTNFPQNELREIALTALEAARQTD